MADAIHEPGRGSGGARVSRGYYAVKPDGLVVLMNPRACLKEGWRYASADEVAAFKAPRHAPAAIVSGDLEVAVLSDADSDGRSSDADSDGRGTDGE